MKLREYDDKLVRIHCIDGKVYEGLCSYNSNDYNYHEYDRDEEGVQLLVFLFFKDDIKKIELISDFSDKYGTLEIEIFNDGIDFIEDVLLGEYDEHIYRMLLCIKDNYKKIKEKEDIINLLNDLIKYNKNKKIIKEAYNVIDIINN